jgi:hypothetical protein
VKTAVTLFAISCLLTSAHAVAAAPAAPTDAYLKGYIAALLKREFDWEPDSYRIAVRAGRVEIAITDKTPTTRALAIQRLGEVPGVRELHVHVASATELTTLTTTNARTTREHLLVSLGADPAHIALPTGSLFAPLIADPKQPQFLVASHQYNAERLETTMGTVAYGQPFGFYRRPGKNPGDGLQLDFAGALFAQFDMYSDSTDLVMADYVFGIPITYRHGNFSWRAQVYHQSSHLGDEYLLRRRPERINLSFEALEVLLSQDFWGARIYGGGQWLFRRSPDDLDDLGAHAGLEYRSRTRYYDAFHWIAALDVKSWEQHDWNLDSSVKFGIDFGTDEPGSRHLKFTLDAYQGTSPYGQLFENSDVTYYGGGIGFGF